MSYVGQFKAVGKVYLHSIVDTDGSYAFGFLHTSKVPVAVVVGEHGREFCGTAAHPFELYLAFNDLTHKRTKVRHPQTNGFVERFHRTVKEEFFEVALRETFYESVEALQADLDRWLAYYNTERTHLGYRNMGKRPIETINAYLTVTQEA